MTLDLFDLECSLCVNPTTAFEQPKIQDSVTHVERVPRLKNETAKQDGEAYTRDPETDVVGVLGVLVPAVYVAGHRRVQVHPWDSYV